MLASYTLELLAVLQIMSCFDHHNCAAKVLSCPLHNLAWSTYCGGHRGFVTCSILVQHLHVTFFFKSVLGMGEQLNVCTHALGLSQLAGPRWLRLPFLGACLPGFIYWETWGKESCSHHYLCLTACKPSRTSKHRVKNQWWEEYPTKLQLWVLNRFESLCAYR